MRSLSAPHPNADRISTLAACTLGLALSYGPVFLSTFSVLLKPIAAEFNWSRTAVSSGLSVVALVHILVAPHVGRLLDQAGYRPVIFWSLAAFAFSIFAVGVLPANYPVFLLLMVIIGISGTAHSLLGYQSVLPQWFDRRLGLSLGVATVGLGIGGTVMPLVAQHLLQDYGWRSYYFIIGGALFTIVLPIQLILLKSPAARNPSPGAGGAATKAPLDQSPTGMTRAEALRTPVFWCLIASTVLVMTVVAGSALHLVPMLTDRGMPAAEAVALYALVGVSVTGSRLVTGFLLDHVPAFLLGAAVVALTAIGVATLSFGPVGAVLLFAMLSIGISQGLEGDLIPYLVRRCFGSREYGAIYGFFNAAYVGGTLIGPLLMAFAFDRLGQYSTMFMIMSGVMLLGAVLLLVGHQMYKKIMVRGHLYVSHTPAH